MSPNFSPTYAMRERLIAEEARRLGDRSPRCYFSTWNGAPDRLARYGACRLDDPRRPRSQRRKRTAPLQAHHLIPQQVIRDLHGSGYFGDVPLALLLADWRNGILTCPGHHGLVEPPGHGTSPRKIKIQLRDLPERFFEFLTQYRLWGEAERLYVRPPGHSGIRAAADLRDAS